MFRGLPQKTNIFPTTLQQYYTINFETLTTWASFKISSSTSCPSKNSIGTDSKTYHNPGLQNTEKKSMTKHFSLVVTSFATSSGLCRHLPTRETHHSVGDVKGESCQGGRVFKRASREVNVRDLSRNLGEGKKKRENQDRKV